MSDEIQFTHRICDEMRACGAVVGTIVGSGAASSNPDRFVVFKELTIFIEFKGLTTPLRTNQAIMIKRMLHQDSKSVVIVREPNRLQTLYQNSMLVDIGEFDRTGKGLLQQLLKLFRDS